MKQTQLYRGINVKWNDNRYYAGRDTSNLSELTWIPFPRRENSSCEFYGGLFPLGRLRAYIQVKMLPLGYAIAHVAREYR